MKSEVYNMDCIEYMRTLPHSRSGIPPEPASCRKGSSAAIRSGREKRMNRPQLFEIRFERLKQRTERIKIK